MVVKELKLKNILSWASYFYYSHFSYSYHRLSKNFYKDSDFSSSFYSSNFSNSSPYSNKISKGEIVISIVWKSNIKDFCNFVRPVPQTYW